MDLHHFRGVHIFPPPGVELSGAWPPNGDDEGAWVATAPNGDDEGAWVATAPNGDDEGAWVATAPNGDDDEANGDD